MHKEATRAKAVFVGQTSDIHDSLSDQAEKTRLQGRNAMIVVFDTARTLARQGLPFRGHEAADGVFKQVLSLISRSGNSELKSWMSRKFNWTSGESQNEILQILHHEVLRKIVSEIHGSKQFGIIVDETSDIANKEQMSIVIRYISKDFVPIESFVGFVNVESTTGEALYDQINMALLSLNIHLEDCVAQGYDGASNMRGKNKGLATRIANNYPMAVYSYCNGHCLNLILQDACKLTALQKGMNLVQRLTTFVRGSPKRAADYATFGLQMGEPILVTTLRPFCPTRWVYRKGSFDKIRENYEALLAWLADLVTKRVGKDRSDALSILTMMTKFSEFYYLCLAQKIFTLVYFTHVQLQNPSLSISEVSRLMTDLVLIIKAESTEGAAQLFYQDCVHIAREKTTQGEIGGLGLGAPQAPRRWMNIHSREDENSTQLRKRLSAPPMQHTEEEVENYFRSQYIEVMTAVILAFEERFQISNVILSMDTYLKTIESVDFPAPSLQAIEAICNHCEQDQHNGTPIPGRTNICKESLVNDLRNLRRYEESIGAEHATTPEQIASIFARNATLRAISQNMAYIVKLLLLVPATSCSAERSFSSLRRLKTYLRSTMGQARLNHLAVVASHKEVTDDLDLEELVDSWRSSIAARENAVAGRKKNDSAKLHSN